MLLSFERPRAPVRGTTPRADLENCTIMPTKHRPARERCERVSPGERSAAKRPGSSALWANTPSEFRSANFADHRQDRKGTRWMPWHQESMKGVNGCDKPR